MPVDRRTFLASTAAGAFVAALPGGALALYAPRPQDWRQFELTTRVEITREDAPVRVWVPVPALAAEAWMRPGPARYEILAGDGGEARLVEDAEAGIAFVEATWPSGNGPVALEVVARAETRSRHVDLARPGNGGVIGDTERALNTAPTRLIPTDGIVKTTADTIVSGATTDLEKARAIYDWVVESTERDPETRGCGLGDVASMLQTGDLTGKCADLNALYVGLARAAGLPARDLYGLRVAPSEFGYRSLGAKSATVTGAQHCRAEVFVEDHGWIAVDPADVRKVALEEGDAPMPLSDPKVQAVREALFGAAEGNWVALNAAHDVALPGAEGGELPFLMYPQAEVDGQRLDELDPASFVYTIPATEIGA